MIERFAQADGYTPKRWVQVVMAGLFMVALVGLFASVAIMVAS